MFGLFVLFEPDIGLPFYFKDVVYFFKIVGNEVERLDAALIESVVEQYFGIVHAELKVWLVGCMKRSLKDLVSLVGVQRAEGFFGVEEPDVGKVLVFYAFHDATGFAPARQVFLPISHGQAHVFVVGVEVLSYGNGLIGFCLVALFEVVVHHV